MADAVVEHISKLKLEGQEGGKMADSSEIKELSPTMETASTSQTATVDTCTTPAAAKEKLLKQEGDEVLPKLEQESEPSRQEDTPATHSAQQIPTAAAFVSRQAHLPKRPPGKLQFVDLPEDIKNTIVDKVIRPSDLKSVCLVNKELHALAVRPLYRHVALDLGSPNDTRLSSFLNPRNIGLKYVRQLRLYLHVNPPDRCLNQEQQAHFATRMLLEFLPEDILEEFSWCPWRPFSADNLVLLYKKQRRMKWLEVMDLDRPVLPELKRDLRLQKAMFTTAKKLALYPENRETLDLSGFVVEKTAAQLEELILHCNFHAIDPRDGEIIGNRELVDSATGPGLLTSSIFRCKLPFEQAAPFPRLRSLRLHRVNLRHCADTWCQIINFQELQFLRLYHCSGADTLLGQLCKARHLPKQLKVLEVQHRDNAENELLLALDGFLCLVSGLRDLVIDLEHTRALPAAAGIVRHGKTLEILNVHCAPPDSSSADRHHHPNAPTASNGVDGAEPDELCWPVADFEKICSACPNLEQLSCAWPATSLIRAPSDEWRAYQFSVARSLVKLVTLHITSWPTNRPSTQLLPRVVYETLLQSLAQRTFQIAVGLASAAAFASSAGTVPPSPEEPSADGIASPAPPVASAADVLPSTRLRLIAFGTSDKIYEREDSRNQLLYLRSTCTDAEGRIRPYAAPLGWCLRQFIEPRSEVLDFVLHRSDPEFRPPCRESVGIGGSGGLGARDGSAIGGLPAGLGGGGGIVVANGGGWGDEDE